MGSGYAVSYRDLEAMMTERGVAVDHSTIFRWVQRFALHRDDDDSGPPIRVR